MFLLNEEKSFLGHKVGDVLTAVQDLQNDLGGMGVRQIAKVSDDIVGELRKILHGQWTPKQQKHLKDLQKVAVALKKAIEEKDDLKELIPSIAQELQTLSGKLGVKVNSLQAPPDMMAGGEDASQADMQLTGNGPAPPQDPNALPPPPTPPMPPGAEMPPPVPMEWYSDIRRTF